MGRKSTGYSGYGQNAVTATPQSQPMPATSQERNQAGGYTWVVDHWTQLDRLLFLGATEGSYYTTKADFTKMNLSSVEKCVKENGQRVLERIITIRQENRAKKLDALLITFAYVLAYASPEVKVNAYRAIPVVASTLRQQLELVSYVVEHRKWSRGLKHGFGHIFREMAVRDLANQIGKYKASKGWTVNDLLRVTHVVEHGTEDAETRKIILNYAKKGWPSVQTTPHENPALVQLWAVERIKELKDTPKEAAKLIKEYRLNLEMVPSELHPDKDVQEALFDSMPATALVRNLSRLTRLGVFDKKANLESALKRLSVDSLAKARVHPFTVFVAHKAYSAGRAPTQADSGDGGGWRVPTHKTAKDAVTWTPNQAIVEALNDAFIGLFKTVKKTGKTFKVGIDVSGSMSGTRVVGTPFVTAVEGAAAIAYQLVQVEDTQNVLTMAFDDQIKAFPINKRMSLSEIQNQVQRMVSGGTDCALPIKDALNKKEHVDTFVILTDSQTWQGRQHPAEALKEYRQNVNRDATMVVVAMSSNEQSIADPKDSGIINIVGFDAHVMSIIAEFAGNGGL